MKKMLRMAVMVGCALAAVSAVVKAAVDETLTYKVTIQPPIGAGPSGGPTVIITISRESNNLQSTADHGGNPATMTRTEKLRWFPTDMELTQLCQAR